MMSLLYLTKLLKRKLVRIEGPDTYAYLQGIVSNDVRQLYRHGFQPDQPVSLSPNSISAFMMNPLGRAICDMLIFRTPKTQRTFQYSPGGHAKGDDEVLLECDSELANSLVRTLTAYRVKRKVALSVVDQTNVWCLYTDTDSSELDHKYQPILSLPETISHEYIVTRDPRLVDLGFRILTPENDVEKIADNLRISKDNYQEAPLSRYTYHRYKLGVGEGRKDNLESQSMPLECNADFLRSVSFTKGCYVGQELTGRIHHTGIVRKRIMPIVLESESKLPLLPGSEIINENDANVGNIRNLQGNRGLALMRVEQTIRSKVLKHKLTGTIVKSHIPSWWPAQINNQEVATSAQ